MMNKVFTDNGWEDYTYWQTEDGHCATHELIEVDDE